MLRTGLCNVPLNAAKRTLVMALLQAYRACASTLAAGQWVRFFKHGAFDRNTKLAPRTTLSARYVQTCQYQVVGALQGFLGNCALAFKGYVLNSSLDEPTRIALLFLNKHRAWYRPTVSLQGKPVPPQLMRLARSIMRAVLARHRKPRLSRCNMALDEKVAIVEGARKPGHFERWLRLSTLKAGKPVLLPLATNPWFEAQPGQYKPFVQVNLDEQGRLWCGRVKDVPTTPYESKMEVLGLDVGLRTLLATSQGDLLGRQVFERLRQLDHQISTLAANRQRSGLRVRSRRYDVLVRRLRAYLENEVRRTLRQALLRHKPAAVTVEMLDLRSPKLSRRMNRLVQNFGRRVFTQALEGYAEQYGFKILDVEPAYSSQRCGECGYVDARNRRRDVFRCLHCRHRAHADVNAARNHVHAACTTVGPGRSSAVRGRPSRRAILQHWVGRFASAKRLDVLQRRLLSQPQLLEEPKRRHRPSRPCMLSNPYFKTVLEPLRARAMAAHSAALPQPL